MRQVYACDKCLSLWHAAEDALDCEKHHLDPVEVKGVSWRTDYQKGYFPDIVRVRVVLPIEHFGYDWATYKFDHTGPRGV